LKGSCRFLLDDGITKEDIIINCPTKGILIDSCLWREMHDFSEDCVLMVLASEYYDESDYIRDYTAFLQEVSQS
ncbi:WxcM-like domain-containing protein, partial [Vibrio anguillarum]